VRTLALILLVCVPAAAQFRWPRLHPRLKKGEVEIHRAIVLPPIVSYGRLTNKGAEGMEAEAEAIASRMQEALASELESRGISVVPTSAGDDAAKYRIADLQNKFDQVRRPVSLRPDRVEYGRFTMGDNVAAFELGKADVLIFVRGMGYVPSKGSKALGAVLLSPGRIFASFEYDLTLVDARSGDVLAFLRGGKLRDLSSRSTEQIVEMLRAPLRHVPLPKPPQK
jgi:hypothetical protein